MKRAMGRLTLQRTIAAACLGMGLLATTPTQAQQKQRPKMVFSAEVIGQEAVKPFNAPSGGGEPRGPGCPSTQKTYCNPQLFEEGTIQQFLLANAMVETEAAAVTYTAAADNFPFRLDRMEFLMGTKEATVLTITHVTLGVWEGNPATGNLIFTFSSDDLIMQHPRIGPGSTGVVVRVDIDPNDPEPIIVNDDGSHKFSIGIQIDAHNQPWPSNCNICFPSDDFCIFMCSLPQVCCPPDSTKNAFVALDSDGTTHQQDNWWWSRSCPGAECPVADPGWNRFSDFGLTDGDWGFRATYTPYICPGVGACCYESDGTCEPHTENDCINAGGDWQGEFSTCAPNPCPQPMGACCKLQGNCEENVARSTCDEINGEVFSQDTSCVVVECQQPPGACCAGNGAGCAYVDQATCVTQYAGNWLGAFVECTQTICEGACCVSSGGCVPLTQTDCSVVPNSEFQGVGVACAANDLCPSGACCLANGTCTLGSPISCANQNGTYKGQGSTCGTANCPQPLGACCFSNGSCLSNRTLGNCTTLGGTWAGENTTCPGACQPACGTADGNMDGLGGVDAKDLTIFTTALVNGASQTQKCHGDFNGSNALDTGDIPGMVNALLHIP